jgi:hypothetical protein
MNTYGEENIEINDDINCTPTFNLKQYQGSYLYHIKPKESKNTLQTLSHLGSSSVVDNIQSETQSMVQLSEGRVPKPTIMRKTTLSQSFVSSERFQNPSVKTHAF